MVITVITAITATRWLSDHIVRRRISTGHTGYTGLKS